MVDKVCKQCGIGFKANPKTKINPKRNKFCSVKCKNDSRVVLICPVHNIERQFKIGIGRRMCEQCRKSSDRKYYYSHREKEIKRSIDYRLKNIDRATKREKKIVEEMRDKYVAQLLGISIHDIRPYPELLETKRVVLKLKRELKKEKNVCQ
jgi:hypothetical protein